MKGFLSPFPFCVCFRSIVCDHLQKYWNRISVTSNNYKCVPNSELLFILKDMLLSQFIFNNKKFNLGSDTCAANFAHYKK